MRPGTTRRMGPDACHPDPATMTNPRRRAWCACTCPETCRATSRGFRANGRPCPAGSRESREGDEVRLRIVCGVRRPTSSANEFIKLAAILSCSSWVRTTARVNRPTLALGAVDDLARVLGHVAEVATGRVFVPGGRPGARGAGWTALGSAFAIRLPGPRRVPEGSLLRPQPGLRRQRDLDFQPRLHPLGHTDDLRLDVIVLLCAPVRVCWSRGTRTPGVCAGLI